VPSQKEYRPGDVAEILVQTPFAPAEVTWSERRQGLVETHHLSLPTGSTTLRVPIEEAFIPNLDVQVDAVGSEPRTDADGKPIAGAPVRPAFASGSLSLSIPPTQRKLHVNVKPAVSAAEPGSKTSVGVTLTDASGQPVAGEVALLMVDESVLALSGYDPADPLDSFYPQRETEVSDSHNRLFVELATAAELQNQLDDKDGAVNGLASFASSTPRGAIFESAKSAPSSIGLGYSGSLKKSSVSRQKEAEPAIALRQNFNPLALFVPAVKTDAKGYALVPVKLPDNLTRYRLIALAVAGEKQFGKGESTLTARQPLMVRPSAPRFLSFGDRCELPVVLQNQTDHDMDVKLACRASNAKLSGAGYRVHVKANDRCEVRFACATDRPGTARFQFAASAGSASDAAEVSLPVWTPATSEAFATYGTVDQGAIAQPIKAPRNVFPQFGGLEVTTSSTALAELTDALLYLESYPYECAEQLSSRVLATAALRDVLAAFNSPALDKTRLTAAMARDLGRLKGQQNYDGGWDYWTRGDPSVPYVSLHVAHALVRAKAKGYTVDPRMLESAMGYVRTIENHIPGDYPEVCKWSLRAYALYVQRLEGSPDPAKAAKLVQEVGVERLPLEALGWVLPTLSKDAELAPEIRRYLANKVSETAATAQFDTAYGDGAYLTLHSSRRDDGILLEALIEDQPSSDLIPKLVRGLLAHRVRGRWENTQENCFILLALDSYFQHYEHATPDFVARVWLGSRYAGQQSFKGRSTAEKLIKIPMSVLSGSQNLVLQKDGAQGRLYYRVGMTYAPRSLKLASSDNGFTVARSYEAMGDSRDVSRDAAGVWHIKAGTEVRVKLTMVAPSRRYHVALVDPLPAGLEPLNPGLAVTGSRPAGRTRTDWWTGSWYDHENLRDERVEAFTQLLQDGVYNYSYIARATTPGSFVVAPAKAEEMYHPETFGRSASDRVEVR
jgi:uncharacterized protein YfaS (alpha-2-macroglobulin family)